MVKIPTYEQQGEYRPSGRIVQGVRTPADDGIARGIQKLGQATLEVAGRIQQANLDQELVKAETDLRVRMDKARQAIELDPETPDVAIPQRWKQESELIIGEVGGTISSSRARELWTIRARGLQAEGDTWSVNLQRKRQVDGVKAGFVAMASEAETMAGDASISPETYASKIGGLRALNASHLESGFIDKEEAARREVLLDGYAAKDTQIRLSDQAEALVRAGDEAGAKALLDSVGDAATKKLVEASIKGTKNEIEAENAKREKEVREAQIQYSNEMEVGILKGQIRSHKDIDAAVASGQIHVNDAPALMRAVTEEQERIKREAERANTLSPAQKRVLEEASADNRQNFQAMMMTSSTRGMFMGDAKDWPPHVRDMYEAMTGDDQRWVDGETLKLRTTGIPADAVTKTYGDLMTVAKRWAPAGWQLGGTSEDALKNKNNTEITAAIVRLADELTPQLNGLPLQQQRAEEEIVRLFKAQDDKLSMTAVPVERDAMVRNQGAAWASAAIDWNLWNKVKATLPPMASSDDVMEAYRMAGGKMP